MVRECATLERRVFSVKKRFLAMYKKANAGHVGTSLSCAELLVLLRLGWMEAGDSFILSKGHAAAALYATLAEAGCLTPQQIDTFYEDGTQLAALPPFGALDEVPFATGSLGYGLSLSAGKALGARLKQEHRRRFFCLTSDGELNEGSVWEAALFISHHKLSSVVWLIDRNRIQATGRTEDVMALEPLESKLRAFGYHVLNIDGHDWASLLTARDTCSALWRDEGAPIAIIANTIKGNGISYMRDTVDCHYLPMSDSQYEVALKELTRAHERKLEGYRHEG